MQLVYVVEIQASEPFLRPSWGDVKKFTQWDILANRENNRKQLFIAKRAERQFLFINHGNEKRIHRGHLPNRKLLEG